MNMTWIIILVVIVLLVLWAISLYNNLVRLRNNRENAFANIDVQLKQRYDLVPQLVGTVKGYAEHEKEVFQRVTEARAAAMGARTINEKIQADNALTGALAGLKVSLEAYPELKANQNFLHLQQQLSGMEEKLANYRQFYNDTVLRYDRLLETVPTNLIAMLFHFERAEFFKVEEAEKAKVNVKF